MMRILAAQVFVANSYDPRGSLVPSTAQYPSQHRRSYEALGRHELPLA